ncbi:hypothetical protein C7445_1043 [Alicyclobacillus sacchari]|uniref:LysM domain-containing protein n=1 Tax=Alicyclobacillus sacchari TaxID=392010 RepID=A0A4R8LPR4_9BACL|nr:hypothetical protein [Alicyclobacillus sacchari]TDY49493.1 hypothetical protein C7445_1043 [Alicyclobacillus sacchari]GMA58664.1 hypothetical protein GCM10025858_31670 [Alicyclobacillus sacchari]
MAYHFTRKTILGTLATTLTLGLGSTAAFASVSHTSHHPVLDASQNRSKVTSSTQQTEDHHDSFNLRQLLLTTAAKDLNISASTLLSDLKSGNTLAEVASAHGVSASTLTSDLDATVQTQLNTEVTDGKLSSSQETTLTSHLDAWISDWVNGKLPNHPAGFHHGGWGAKFDFQGSILSTAAQDLNLSTSALESDLKSGKTLAEIASTQGVSTSTLISDLESSIQSDLNTAVSNGTLTATQETNIQSRLDSWITNWVNGTFPQGAHMQGGQPTTSSSDNSPTTNQA